MDEMYVFSADDCMTTILIIEDERRIAGWIQAYAERDGYDCLLAHDGMTGLQLALTDAPDVVILDILLPGLSGWEVCERIRETSDVPIIMLTALINEEEIIRGLKLGADDYLTKPFSPAELMARIEANLRRTNAAGSPSESKNLYAKDILLNQDSHHCVVRGESVKLTANQFKLLVFFMEHPNQVFSRDQLIDRVFGIDYDSYERAIDIHIRRLRMKIERDPSSPEYIQTVFGAGYKFSPEG